MLKALRLGNFKAFADTQRIPLCPLTIIFGANSSGKSSLIHGLLLARHALDKGDLDVHRTEIGGDSVDLGGFRQYVHRREARRRVEWSAEIDTSWLEGRVAELLAPVKIATVSATIGVELDDRDEPVPGAVPVLMSYEIEADSVSLLRMSRRPDGHLRLDRLNHEHTVFREAIQAMVALSTTTDSLSSSDFEGLGEAIDEMVPEISVRAEKFLPDQFEKMPGNSVGALFFTISKDRRKEDLAAAVRFFIPRKLEELIRGLNGALASELARLRYLGPLRSYPPRHIAFSQHHDPNWFAGGGYAWDVVRRDQKVREAVNVWLNSADRLQTPYQLKVRELVGTEDVEEAMVYFLQSPEGLRGMDFVGIESDEVETSAEEEASRFLEMIEDARVERLQELILVDCRTNTPVSHRDVGIGISQVLPVLVGAYASKKAILPIEQPEIHLHPKLQAELGDVFIQSALGERRNTFIIETHSEHLILRILKRIRQTTAGKNEFTPAIKPEHVSILFVNGERTGSTIQQLRVDARGRIIDRIPGGFFEESFEELF